MNMTVRDLDALYAILNEQTPIVGDCGKLCGSLCCGNDSDELCGVDLLPIEAECLKDADWASIETDPITGRPMLMCTAPCDRSRRPWLCRIFPACTVEGGKRVRTDARARGVCPLADHGIRALSIDFKKAVHDSARFLAGFSDGADFLRQWETLEQEFRTPLW